MWQCPQCGEEHEDHFNECWNSSSTTTRPSSTANSATWNPHFPSPLRLRQRLHRRHPRLHAPRRNPRQPPPRTRRLPPGKKRILRRRRKTQIKTAHILPRTRQTVVSQTSHSPGSAPFSILHCHSAVCIFFDFRSSLLLFHPQYPTLQSIWRSGPNKRSGICETTTGPTEVCLWS